SGFRPLCNIPHCCLPYESGPCLSPSVAGRPLRPATRRRLGRPSPHQQADRPRAHPQPKNLSTTPHARSSEYPVLAPVSEGYPKAKGRLLTCYSPVRRSSTPERAFPLDLHVLSTPPAFVLSQDQTLRRKTNPHPTPPPKKEQQPGAETTDRHPDKTNPDKKMSELSSHQRNPSPTNQKTASRGQGN